MLDLTLRNEFRGRNMPGTTIALHSRTNQGAADRSPEEFLAITYPTADVINALRTVREGRDGGPVVLMGGRGKGKSHLMAVLHHAVKTPDATEKWLSGWADKLDDPSLRSLKIARGFAPISETVNDNEFRTLWELLFARHPRGEYFRGKFAESGQHIPAKSLLEEMFADQPTCLILDEFQSWYDALPEEYQGIKCKDSAFSFIQMLSEISRDRPEILMFIVSVRNNQTDAFRQLHRQNLTQITFSGKTAKSDRQKLILHRLFENRLNIPPDKIVELTSTYAKERFRLISSHRGSSNPQRDIDEVRDCWPFAPELMVLLDDQILMASAAQETRDMIRILATVFKSRGAESPVITSACFAVDDDSSESQALVDSITQVPGQEKLREFARRNLEKIAESGVSIPRREAMVSAIWMHSMAPDRLRGITSAELQLAISAREAMDDNQFQLQLGLLVENSVYIHDNHQKYWFDQGENHRTEVRVAAKNDSLWDIHADPANSRNHPGKDVEWLMRTMRKCFIGESTQAPGEVIVLGPNWREEPWKEVEEREQPSQWSKLVLLVVPGAFTGNAQINATLGVWLKNHVSRRRNTVRFLLQDGDKDLFADPALMFLARCSYLCSRDVWGKNSEYGNLFSEFDNPLVKAIKSRFKRFAVLRKWDYQNPAQCEFDLETLTKSGTEAPAEVEDAIFRNVFNRLEFQKRIQTAAKAGYQIGRVLSDLFFLEPNPGDVLAFLGEQKTLSLLQEFAAQGEIALNVDGSWFRKEAGQTFEEALRNIRSKTTRDGSELARILLGTVDATGGGGTVTTPPTGGGGTVTTPPTGGGGAVTTPPTDGGGTVTTPPTGSGGTVPTPPTGGGGVVATSPTGSGGAGAPGGGSGGTYVVLSGGGGAGAPGGGSGGSEVNEAGTPFLNTRHAEPTNGSSLSGKFEAWNLRPEQKLKSATLTMDGITVQELKNLILQLPEGREASLDVAFEAEEQS